MGRKIISATIAKIAVFISAIVAWVPASAQRTITTPAVVNTFYGGMSKLSNCPDNATAGQLEMNMRNCFFGKEDSGMSLPNDFRYFDADKESASHNLDVLTSNNYVSKLRRYMYPEKKLHPDVNVSSVSLKVGSLPSFSNGRLSVQDAYVATVVRKSFAMGSDRRDFIDTVYTHIQMNKIAMIVNNTQIVGIIDPAKLRVDAARAYHNKEYEKAYNLFLKIIDADRKDGDSYYCLALMTYYGKGCRKNRKEGMRYLSLAQDYLPYSERHRAYNVERYWRYPNQ